MKRCRIICLVVLCLFALLVSTCAAIAVETVRFDTSTIEGNNGWFGTAKVNLNLPAEGKWIAWVRYLDNGVRELEMTLNGKATRMPLNMNNNFAKVGEITERDLDIIIKGVGKYAVQAECMVFSTSETLDPNNLTPKELDALPRITTPLGYAKQLMVDHPNWSITQWVDAVRKHYELPKPRSVEMIDKYGNILLNGKPFIGLLMFHSSATDKRLFDVKEINAYLGGTDDTFAKRGIVAIPSYDSAWRAYDLIAQDANKNRHPLTLMHYICDEPENTMVTPDELKRLNALVKAADPEKPTLINVSPTFAANAAVVTIPDIVGLDIYPIPSGRIYDVGRLLDQVKLSSGGKPVVSIVQTFSWAAYGREGARFPTPAEVRAMTYVSLVHNAKGLWFYEWPAPTMSSETCLADIQPELWADMRSMFKEVASLAPALSGPEVALPFAASSNAQPGKSPEFKLAVSADRKTCYLISVQPWDSACKAVLDFKKGPLADASISDAFQNQKVSVTSLGKGRYELNFQPMGSGVFKITSKHLKSLVAFSKQKSLDALKTKLNSNPDQARGKVPFLKTTPSDASESWKGSLDLLDSWKSTKRPMAAQVAATKQGLCIHVLTRFPVGSKSTTTQRDGPVWGDPCIELFIGTSRKANHYIQLAVNTANVQFDQITDPSKGFDLGANYDWESSVSSGTEQAEYRVVIPWTMLKTALGISPGDKMTFNLASGASGWDWVGLTGVGMHSPSRFGVLTLPKLQ